MHRITAKTMLQMWIYGFFPEYKFRQDDSKAVKIPKCENEYVWECERQRKSDKMRYWTDAEVEKLKVWFEEGIPYKQMAIMLDRDVKTIYNKCRKFKNYEIVKKARKNGDKRSYWSDADVENLKIWLKEGKSCKQIATMLDRDVKTIYNKIAKLKIKSEIVEEARL